MGTGNPFLCSPLKPINPVFEERTAVRSSHSLLLGATFPFYLKRTLPNLYRLAVKALTPSLPCREQSH